MVARGESQTDWERVHAMTEEEVERNADLDDLGEDPMPDGRKWTVFKGMPTLAPVKKEIHIRLDEDVLDWFRAQGARYQTRINAVLRAFVQAQKDASGHR
jgi:uncharacterized protein (DUF4415 family)